MMKRSALVAAFPVLLVSGGAFAANPSTAAEQIAQSAPPSPAAGVIPLGVTVIELQAVIAGLSCKKDILGKHVQNDRKEDLGRIEDLIITQKDEAAYAIVSVGGFLGIGGRLVTIPTRQLKQDSGHFVLAGATKDVLRAMPPFVYAH
jgi:hypothetical protein